MNRPMGSRARAGRRHLLRPTRPRLTRPSSIYVEPQFIYGRGDVWINGDVLDVMRLVQLWTETEPVALGWSAELDLDVVIDPGAVPTGVPFRSDLAVTHDMPSPAIVHGKPLIPKEGWLNPSYSFSGGSGTTVHTKPEPVPPPIVTRPENDNPTGSDILIWQSSDLTQSPGDAIGYWPEKNGGPAFHSAAPYRPSMGYQAVYTSRGKVRVYDKMAVFDYRNVEHMWVNVGRNLSGPFTWVIVGIILSYPTARYGHYLLDHGHDPGSNGINFGFTKKVGGESGHRSALLYQRSSALIGTTFPTIETGPYARSRHNYTPQPRMFYGVFNTTSSTIGVRGRNYHERARGTVLAKTHRKFVVGRRNSYTSTDLASHMAIFEMRFYPDNLNRTELDKVYYAMRKKYDFDKYRI